MSVAKFCSLVAGAKLGEADKKRFPRWIRSYASSLKISKGDLRVTEADVIDSSKSLRYTKTPAWRRLQAVRAIESYRNLVLKTKEPNQPTERDARMKMKTRFMLAALLGLCALGGLCASGCRRSRQDDGKIVIGLAVPSLTHPFFIYLQDNIMDEAAELGVEIAAMDAEDMAAKQMSIIEDFIVRDVDGVLLAPIGADSLVPAVESLNQAGIPVATVDREVSGGQVFVHVGADNVEGGRVAGRYLIERIGEDGRIIELEGTPGASPAIDRKKGFREVIDAAGIEVIASQTADFKRVQGQTVMENLLQVHSDFQGVYAANDEMMLGAIEAMEANNVAESDVVTVGYDAIPEALDSIRAGRVDATVEQYPGRQARTALRILVAHIRDGSMPEAERIEIKPVIIDADNLDQAEEKGAMRVE